MRRRSIRIIAWSAAAAVLLVITLTAGDYQSPLLDDSDRNLIEIIRGYFGFGWHYSCHIWLERSRQWKDSTRQKVLAFWYRPDYAGFQDLREKSFLQLGSLYERLLLPRRASEMFIEACRREPENRWLIQRSGSRIIKMEQWDKLEELRCVLWEANRGDCRAQRWLNICEPGGPKDQILSEQADEN